MYCSYRALILSTEKENSLQFPVSPEKSDKPKPFSLPEPSTSVLTENGSVTIHPRSADADRKSIKRKFKLIEVDYEKEQSMEDKRTEMIRYLTEVSAEIPPKTLFILFLITWFVYYCYLEFC